MLDQMLSEPITFISGLLSGTGLTYASKFLSAGVVSGWNKAVLIGSKFHVSRPSMDEIAIAVLERAQPMFDAAAAKAVAALKTDEVVAASTVTTVQVSTVQAAP